MDTIEVKRIIEALLFVNGEPVALKRLRNVLGELDQQTLRPLIEQLNADYQQTGRAFRIQEVAGGYQLMTDPQLAPWIKRSLPLPKEDSLSKPALETLAIIAYRQPITKAEIEAIRGVDVTGTLDTLLERLFIRVAGRKDTPGRPILYGTTEEFLRHFGLKGVQDLPPMQSKSMPGLGDESEALKPLITHPELPPEAASPQPVAEAAEGQQVASSS